MRLPLPRLPAVKEPKFAQKFCRELHSLHAFNIVDRVYQSHIAVNMAPSFDNLPDDVDLDDIEVDYSGAFAFFPRSFLKKYILHNQCKRHSLTIYIRSQGAI